MRNIMKAAAALVLALAFGLGLTVDAAASPSTKPVRSMTAAMAERLEWQEAMVENGWRKLGHAVDDPSGKWHRHCYINTTPNITFLLCYDGYRDVS